jgi:hypothetical protein
LAELQGGEGEVGGEVGGEGENEEMQEGDVKGKGKAATDVRYDMLYVCVCVYIYIYDFSVRYNTLHVNVYVCLAGFRGQSWMQEHAAYMHTYKGHILKCITLCMHAHIHGYIRRLTQQQHVLF